MSNPAPSNLAPGNPPTSAAKVPPWALAVASMTSVQLGSALSVHLISSVGPAGTAWLRLTMGAAIFLVLARPPLRTLRRHDVATLAGLGVTTGLQTIAFLAAIERIPLGTAVAIEFLGPLTVAAVRSHSLGALIWPALARPRQPGRAGLRRALGGWLGHLHPAHPAGRRPFHRHPGARADHADLRR